MTDSAKFHLDRRSMLAAAAAAGVVPATMTWGPGRASAAADLLIFDWTGYEIPELHQPYIAKYGASPEVAVYADTYEAFNKIQAGFRCDTVHPNVWDVRRFYDAGLLQAWQPEKLQYWPDVYPELANSEGAVIDGKQLMIPTDWGFNAMIVRSDIVEFDGTPSWNLLWDERYAGRISMNGEMDAAVVTAALVLGIDDPFHATDEEFAAIEAKLREQRPLVLYYWTDPTELGQSIAGGEVVAAWAWPQVYGDLTKESQPVAYHTPSEGVYNWMTGFVRLAEAPGKEQNAYDYVDAWLAPETGKWLIENYGYGHTNRNSFALVTAEVLEEKGLGQPDQVLASTKATREFDPALRDRFVNMYEEVKAGF